ncbi:MAG: hypothetical protein RLZZ223_117 [Candidatus Parcubacteria bacterium]|jgi:cell division protein FtsW
MPLKSRNILQKADPVFVVLSGVLLLVGLIILQSASGYVSYTRYGGAYVELIKQLKFGVIPGIILFFLFANINYRWLKRLSGIGWVSVIVLNILIFLPGIGVTVNGATRWIKIGSIQIQPSEILKLALIIYLGALLTSLDKKINQKRSLFIVAAVMAISSVIVLYFQSNLSTGAILLVISISMIFQSKIKTQYIFGFFGVLVIAGILSIATVEYRRDRVKTLFQPKQSQTEKDGSAYQINNNLIAVGSGGLFGVGWGESRQKFGYLPEVSTDSIFAIFAEESGFVGVALLVSLFLSIILRILWLASQVEDYFGRYILIGAATWLALQTFINIATTIRLFPVTGVPLPFISSGGTSLLVFCILFGIISNISQYRVHK